MALKACPPPSSPSARKLAAENGIDLQGIRGTGPDGKITRGDVEAALREGSGGASPALEEAVPPESPASGQDAIAASPLARRLAEENGIDLASITGSGPGGKIVKADVENFDPAAAPATPIEPAAIRPGIIQQRGDLDPPYEAVKLNNVRKVIARRLTESKQSVPHIYLTVDVRLDALLELRKELNTGLAADGGKLSVNDFLIKALARALRQVPDCNVSFQGDQLYRYSRQDISVAVAAPSGLITPIVFDAADKALAQISTEMKDLAGKAREGKLQPHEFQGGTASLSNLGMFGIKQFDAVINPPQGMILAVGSGELRPHVIDGALAIASVMSATGSFDHRAIDGADGAQLMDAFRQLCEHPMTLVG